MSAPVTMVFDYVAMTDAGRVRDNNEDSVACDLAQGIAVLADGMGGYNAGEIASAMAVTFVKTELARWLVEVGPDVGTNDIRHALEICVSHANLSIYNAACANPQFSGMGTTVVAGYFDAKRVILAHVGDSRCYLWRGGRLTQITRDHSLLQEQIDAGLISREQARFSAHKNLVTRALGVEDTVQVDSQDRTPMPNDIYLMCSDGLSDMLEDTDIAKVMAQDAALGERAAALIKAANDAGGRDNISVILVHAKAKSNAQGFFSRMLRKP